MKVIKLNYIRERVNKVNRMRRREFVATTVVAKVTVRVPLTEVSPKTPVSDCQDANEMASTFCLHLKKRLINCGTQQ